MSLDAELSFADLVDARRELAELTRPHRDSVNFFAADWGFHRTSVDVKSPVDPEPPSIAVLADPAELKGITTALTCFESLMDAASADGRSSLFPADDARLKQFAENALSHPGSWKSEGAARRYCIVRAAAPLMSFGYDKNPALRSNLEEVWKTVESDPARCGVFEMGQDANGVPGLPYPPNAFLTYWALKAMQHAPTVRRGIQSRIDGTETWLRSVVGREVALHFDQVPGRDPQQIVWAIGGILVARNVAMADRANGTAETLRAGLRAFFEQQNHGTWDRGGALFHYPGAGNAYCYPFETLAELLTLALNSTNLAAAELRQLLRPYLSNLLQAKDFLARTARELSHDRSESRMVGWSSNHHPHRTTPESWATATSFRFLQALRRFVALEVRDTAARQLRARAALKDLKSLQSWGDTWVTAGMASAGALLGSLFVHPNVTNQSPTMPVDPDRPALESNVARSAILFGPPGTGKTTLVESVAGALGWGFVEITPADFLDRGSEFVSARADEIFKQLMELDRCVVLFDEIDELIRDRAVASEALSRFFTTTMLPRLARLWERRRLLFFVNTNSIGDVDPAVVRSQRFDAAIYVLPPSLQRKVQMLGDAGKHIDAAKILSVFANLPNQPAGLSDDDYCMAGLAFLRYDQMEMLKLFPPQSRSDLQEQIGRFCHELLRTWHPQPLAPGTGTPHDELRLLLEAYKSEAEFQRVDATRLRIVADPSGVGLRDGLVNHTPGFLLWNPNTVLPDGLLDGAAQVRVAV